VLAYVFVMIDMISVPPGSSIKTSELTDPWTTSSTVPFTSFPALIFIGASLMKSPPRGGDNMGINKKTQVLNAAD